MNFSLKKIPVSVWATTLGVSGASLAAEPAKAITLQRNNASPESGSRLIDFESFTPGPLPSSFTLGDVTVTVTPVGSNPSSVSVELDEGDPNDLSDDNQFLQVGADGARGEITFTFAKDQRFFGFEQLQGSNNNNLEIEFLDEFGIVVDDFTASNTSRRSTPNYVSFFASSDGSDAWRSVRFRDDQTNGNFWEIDNISYSNVPTPALLPGLFGMGVAAMRKRRQSTEKETV